MSCEPLLQTLFVQAHKTPQCLRGVGAPADKYLDISVGDFPDRGEFGKGHPGWGRENCLTFFYSVGSVAHPDNFLGKVNGLKHSHHGATSFKRYISNDRVLYDCLL